MTYNEIISDLKGEAGTTVNVEVVRDGEHLTFSVERGAYQIQTVDYRTYEYQNKKVGIIRLEEFETATVSQFQSAVDDLTGQGVSALVIDLRDNPGGELTSVIDISDYLLPDGGPIVHIRDKNDEKTTYDADDGHSVDLPIAVLMNENTASAAELFSSALRDYQKAILVGETSYGKGCVQSLISMTSGDVLRLTVAFYDPPYSENFDEIGLTPDVEVKDPDGGFACFYQLQTEDDTVMMTAIQSLFTDK